MHFLGIDWVGVNPENGRKLLLSLVFIFGVVVISKLLRAAIGLVLSRHRPRRRTNAILEPARHQPAFHGHPDRRAAVDLVQ